MLAVVLPLALICPLALKPSLVPSPLSHFIALWLSLIFTLSSLHLCHFHYLLIGLFISISALFISSSILLFHASSLFLSPCPQQASVFVSPSSFSPPPHNAHSQTLLLQSSFSPSLSRPHLLVRVCVWWLRWRV